MFTPQRCLMSGTSYSHLSLFLGGVTWTFFSFSFPSHRCSDQHGCFLRSPRHCMCFSKGNSGTDLKVIEVSRKTTLSQVYSKSKNISSTTKVLGKKWKDQWLLMGRFQWEIQVYSLRCCRSQWVKSINIIIPNTPKIPNSWGVSVF